MGWALVQSTAWGAGSVTLGSNISAGNRVLVWVANTSGVTISDTRNNSYVQHVTQTNGTRIMAIYSAVAGSSGAVTITATPSATLMAAEYSGLSLVSGASAIDVTAGGNDSAVTAPTQFNNELAIGGVAASVAQGGPFTGWAAVGSTGLNQIAEDQDSGVAGSTITLQPTAGSGTAVAIAVFFLSTQRASTRQITVFNYHRTVCQQIGIPQSILRHKSLQGILGTPSSTGNVIYQDPLAQTADPATTNSRVWAIYQELPRFGGVEVEEPARLGLGSLRGQCPALDDLQNVISVEHDDWLDDPLGRHYRILDPVLSPDDGYWAFQLKRER